jgi:hypothetical protein
MNLRIASCSLAVSAAFGATVAQAAPSVYFATPANGATISGNLYQSSACEVRGSNIRQVRFFLDGTALNTESGSPWNCNLDTRRFSDGTHTLRAVAYDSAGASASTQIGVTIRNSTSSGSSGPSVSWRSPSEGATLSGAISLGSACEVAGSGISRVIFHLDGTQLNTELGSPWQCTFDTRKFSDGAHTLKAVAYNASGAATTVTRSVTIRNSTSSPTPTPPPSGSGPTVSWKTPGTGATISGALSGSACEVAGSNLVRTRFWLNGNGLNDDSASPFQCNLDTRKYADGNYTLYVTGWDSSGKSVSAGVPVTVRNGSSTPTSPTSPGAPTVSFKTPTAGATLKGSISQSPACEVVGTNIAKVAFSLDGTPLNTESGAPWNCNLDTRKFKDGTHTLMAVASNSAGASASTQVSVKIQNGTTTPSDPTSPGSGSAVSSADVLGSARADVSFAQQTGYTAQVVGTYTSAPSIPDSGIHYNTLPNGETLRFGKQADPSNSARKALAFQLAYTDPATSGSHRTEISFPQRIELNKVYWVAFSMYVPDWGQLSTSDVATVGMQVHGSGPGLSPAIQLASKGGRTFWIDARTSSSNPATASTSSSTKSPEFPLPINRWADIVIKFKLDPAGNGFVQAWMDGTQIWNFNGKVGYYIGDLKNYVKFGYYNWTAFPTPRKVLTRGNVYLLDPTGGKYKPEDIRSHIRNNG